MTNLPMNRLWALPATKEALKVAEQYTYNYAEPDHILVVSADMPQGAKEITEEYFPLLGKEDWAWLRLTSEQIRNRQAAEFQKEIQKQQDKFLSRFEEKLKALRKEGAADGREKAETGE